MATIEKEIEVSSCCKTDIYYVKGSYMGETFDTCSRCDKRCKPVKKTIRVVDKTPHPFSRYNPNEFNAG